MSYWWLGLRRGRSDRTTISLLLASEAVLLLLFAVYALWDVAAVRPQIVILAVAMGDSTGLRDIREQMTLIASYLLGALLAGVLAVNKVSAVDFLPLAGVAVALAAHQLGGRLGGDIPASGDTCASGDLPRQ